MSDVVVKLGDGTEWERWGPIPDDQLTEFLERKRLYWQTLRVTLKKITCGHRVTYEPMVKDTDNRVVWVGMPVTLEFLRNTVYRWQAVWEFITVEAVEELPITEVVEVGYDSPSLSIRALSGGLPTLGRRRR